MERLLIVGAGDIARRALPALLARYATTVVVRGNPAPLVDPGVRTVAGDLDPPESLAPLTHAAHVVLPAAPPTESGSRDGRTRNLVAALAGARMLPRRVVCISPSGVYGDCAA